MLNTKNEFIFLCLTKGEDFNYYFLNILYFILIFNKKGGDNYIKNILFFLTLVRFMHKKEEEFDVIFEES